MKRDEIYAKLIALSIIYEKDESLRLPYLERITCRSGELEAVLNEVTDIHFRDWIVSVSPIIRH